MFSKWWLYYERYSQLKWTLWVWSERFKLKSIRLLRSKDSIEQAIQLLSSDSEESEVLGINIGFSVLNYTEHNKRNTFSELIFKSLNGKKTGILKAAIKSFRIDFLKDESLSQFNRIFIERIYGYFFSDKITTRILVFDFLFKLGSHIPEKYRCSFRTNVYETISKDLSDETLYYFSTQITNFLEYLKLKYEEF